MASNPALPEHLLFGRANFPGPVSGGYVAFGGGPFDIAVADNPDAIHWGFIAPFDMRIEQVNWGSPNTATGASLTLGIQKNTSFSASGATDIMAAVDLDVNEIGYADMSGDGTATLVAAARDITKGDYVFATTNDGGGSLDGLYVMIVGFSKGHINLDSVND